MKKIISIGLFCMFLFGSSFSLQALEINEKEVFYNQHSSDKSSEITRNVNQDTLSISSELQQTTTIKNSNLPSYWNWQNINGIDWTTPAKNQKHFPICDIFAIIGALESVIKIREECAEFNPDLSEQYVISCYNNYYEEINGTIFEFCFPYEARFVPCSQKSPDWEKYFVQCSSITSITGVAKEFIKNKLFEHGPLSLSIFAPGWSYLSNGLLGIWGRFHNNPNDYFSLKVPKSLGLNHRILLVGWKDDPSVNNGGYWICKNCWGTNWGYDGFFNLAYGSLNTDIGDIEWVDYEPNDFNWPPIGNPTLNGPTFMEANVEYEFTFSSIDPEGDLVYYNFSWDDGTYSGWQGPFESGGIISLKHTWTKEGSYNVRVKAKNENGPESDLMPKNSQSSQGSSSSSSSSSSQSQSLGSSSSQTANI